MYRLNHSTSYVLTLKTIEEVNASRIDCVVAN